MPEPTVFNGRYELHRRLGRGGMAEVFLARDLQLDRPVAVKVLFTEFAADPAFVARFRREAQAAANLNHPNIVSVYDWGQEHGTYFIVMEYVDGRTLAEMIRQDGPLSPDRAADVGADVAAALGHAHASGVLHRDIKPGNILVTPNGRVKVADWGIGRAMDAADENLTQTGAVMGTATYFSPEQAQGLSLDPRSDLYSLGVVLYEALTGTTPFRGEGPVAIAYKHVHEQPRPPRELNPAIPAPLEAIVTQLLAKDPARRYPSADALHDDLRRYREGGRVEAATSAMPAFGAAAAAGAAGAAATQAIPALERTRAQQAYRDAGAVAVDEDTAGGPPPPPQRRSSAFLVVLVVLLLVLGGLLYLLARTLGAGDDGEEVAQVLVPDVVGQPVDAAEQQLVAEGFEVVREDREVTDPAQVGIVLDQDPQGGIEAPEGSEVTLGVGAQELLAVPDVEGLDVDAAERALRDAGFTGAVVVGGEEPSEDLEAGLVIRTEPPAGQEVPVNAEIRLVVSSGPPPVGVPAIAPGGCDVNAAFALLTDSGFTPAQERVPSNEVPEGCIVGTDPPGGTELEQGATVTVLVSAGPEEVPVPDVEGLSESEASQRLGAAGFAVAVDTRPALGDEQPGTVVRQRPPAGFDAEPGSTVTITIATERGDGGNGGGGGSGSGGGTTTTPTTDVGD